MANLPGKAWMDEDGRHVWFEHQCVDGMHRSMLPYPKWHSDGGGGIPGGTPAVTPSIHCTVPGCDFHSHPLIGQPPADWTPRPNSADSTQDRG